METDAVTTGRGGRPGKDYDTTGTTGGTKAMEKALWYLLVGTRGGRNRARIIRALSERPRNANQLAGELDVDYNTVRHHLDMLGKHDVVEKGDTDYGAMYFLTDQFEYHRETFEDVLDHVE